LLENYLAAAEIKKAGIAGEKHYLLNATLFEKIKKYC
jgi:hypothetical protein